MSKKNRQINNEVENEVKVNTPEQEEEMTEDEKTFYDGEKDEDLDGDLQDIDEDDDQDDEDRKVPEAPKKKRFGFFKKHWKFVLGTTVVIVIGGVAFVYIMGKKPIKVKTEKLFGKKGADVVDFEAAKESLIEMAKDAGNDVVKDTIEKVVG